MKISTKTGDNKLTDAIFKRVYKDDPLIECVGTLDELQVSLMHAYNFVANEKIKNHLKSLVKKLFLFGEDLLRSTKNINSKDVLEIEEKIQYYEEQLPEQKAFILPGKTPESSLLHISRTVTRRLERRIVTYGKGQNIDLNIYAFINRLSDLLYIYARVTE